MASVRDVREAALIDRVQELQLAFIHRLLSSPPGSLFDIQVMPSFHYPLTGERPDAAKARAAWIQSRRVMQ